MSVYRTIGPLVGYAKTKSADRLQGNHAADQRLCCHYIHITIPLLPKSKNFKPQTAVEKQPAQFVSDLVGNTKDRFSHDMAHIIHVPPSSFYVPKSELPLSL